MIANTPSENCLAVRECPDTMQAGHSALLAIPARSAQWRISVRGSGCRPVSEPSASYAASSFFGLGKGEFGT